MIARHLLWHVGVAAGAVAVLTVFGVPFSSALPIGIMAGCLAMVFGAGHTGHRHDAANRQPRADGKVEHR
jgi:hypothetical protein